MRRLPDDRPFEAGLRTTLQLLYCPIDVIDRYRPDADQTIGSDFAIINQPVVVCSETGVLQLCVVHGEVRQQIGRIKHLGTKPIGFHLLDPAIWVRPAGMGLEAFTYFEHRKNRSLFSERRWHSLLYGIGWFHHMGVRRNQHLAACVVSVASHKVFPPLAVSFVLSKVEFQTPPRCSIGRSTTTDLNGSRFCKNGVLEYRGVGILVFNASLRYSSTPLLQSLTQSFLFQLPRDALVNDVFGFELANLLVASAENTDHVAQPIDIGINTPVVKNLHHVIARLGIFYFRQPQCAHQALRSEEHTSELQSLRHLVCRLLLE